MTGLWTTVTNVTNGKSYFVSTVKCPCSGVGFHQAAVFRKIFGPIANFWRPKAIFFSSNAASLHARVTEFVRDVDPAGWNDKSRFIFSAEGDEVLAGIDSMRITFDSMRASRG
jgi:hypothetical protein